VTRRAWIVFVAVLIGLFQASNVAWACSCVGPKGLDVLSSNAAVFSGKVTAIEYLEPDSDSAEPPIRVTFEVSEVWKGPVRHTVTLETVYNKYSCNGYFFKEGQLYLVAAQTVTRDDTESDTVELEGISLCGGTSALSDAEKNLEEFGEGQRPE
jgi:hypothetical protein